MRLPGPYSGSQFWNLKYQPELPERFASEQHTRVFCQEFFPWHNHEHRHSGIGHMSPASMRSGGTLGLYEAS